MTKSGPKPKYPGLPRWAGRLSRVRQAELSALLRQASVRAADALEEVRTRVVADVLSAYPREAFVAEYNKGYHQALVDAIEAGFPAHGIGSGFQTIAIGGRVERMGADGRLGLGGVPLNG